jgi:membrane protease subunit (stomatin/prohibitin family)
MPTPQRRSRRRGMMMGAAIANSRSSKAASQQSSAPAPQNTATPDITKQLTDLKGLLDDGILTQEEFDAKKKQILNL